MAAWNNPLTSRFGGLAGTLAIALLLTLGGCGGEDDGSLAGLLTPPETGSVPPPSSPTPPPTETPPPETNPIVGDATLSWYPPTERTDGTPLDALAGYRIVYGTESRSYSESIDLSNPGLTRYYIDGLGAATWYFAIIAIDSQGMESAPSVEVSKTI